MQAITIFSNAITINLLIHHTTLYKLYSSMHSVFAPPNDQATTWCLSLSNFDSLWPNIFCNIECSTMVVVGALALSFLQRLTSPSLADLFYCSFALLLLSVDFELVELFDGVTFRIASVLKLIPFSHWSLLQIY